MFIEVSKDLKALAKFFPENLYIVGGYVRNSILGLPAADVDLAGSVDVEEVSKRLSGSEYSVKVKNLRLGSIVISKGEENYEYTAFRKEKYLDDGSHSPSYIERTQSLQEDALRRDFSVNCIYYNINKDELFDLHHGVIDLNDKLIRTVTDSDIVLQNDGERILRMVRLAGELGFEIEKQTFKSAAKFVGNLKDISGNRKLLEMEKILYCEQKYGQNKKSLKNALENLNKLGVWKFFDLPVSKIKYKMVYNAQDRFIGLLIDIIDSVQVESLQSFLEEFLKNQFGISCSSQHNIFDYLSGYYYALEGMNNKEFFLKFFDDWANIAQLLAAKSKRLHNRYNFFYRYIIEHGLIVSVADLAIDQNDIKKAFPKLDKRFYDRILKGLLCKVFDEKLKNEKEVLLQEIEKNIKNY